MLPVRQTKVHLISFPLMLCLTFSLSSATGAIPSGKNGGEGFFLRVHLHQSEGHLAHVYGDFTQLRLNKEKLMVKLVDGEGFFLLLKFGCLVEFL